MTTPWEADNDLAEQENLFPEYLEMGGYLYFIIDWLFTLTEF